MQFAVRILILLFLSSFCRLLFYVFNHQYFPSASFVEFVYGVRFDASMICWMSFPLIVFSALSAVNPIGRIMNYISRYYFLIIVLIIICLNFTDMGFYPFVYKRLTADSAGVASDGNDFINYIIPLMIDFWYLFLIGLGGFAVFVWVEKKYVFTLSVWKKWTLFVYLPIIGLFVLGARGGWQLKPITLIDASLGVPPENTALVLNTPFTLFTTLYAGSDIEKDVMGSKEAKAIFSIDKKIIANRSESNKNVVILIMESFSKEYLEEGYMPFLDSLKQHGLYFNNAMANGKRSVDAVPAILASIPDLQSSSFIYSSYASNTINSLPSVLKKKGYKTSFFHGGRTGTMGFDKFAALAGVERYYGAEDYPNQNQFDGTWGIYDEPYFQFMVDELRKVKEPFFSTFFSLSSHHPYKIPKQYKGVFPKGSLDIHESIGYSDHALKLFFQSAEKESWYLNTLFVIMADHTSISDNNYYNSSLGMYRIPMLFFSPSDSTIKNESHQIAQQADVFPTVLSYLGINEEIKAFGKNLFETADSNHYVLNRSSGVYYLYDNNRVFEATLDESKGVYLYADSLKSNNMLEKITTATELENEVKARFQVYKDVFSTNGYFYTD